jgi:hypothetical protein
MSVARRNAISVVVNAGKLREHVRITAGNIVILYSEAVPAHVTPVSIEAYATLLPIDTMLKRLSMMPISFLKKAAAEETSQTSISKRSMRSYPLS